MKRKCLILVAGITAALSFGALGQQDEKLGKLSFPTSCDPKVQADFERGVAMIHSYWFIYARKTFEGVLQQDPGCAIAYWGIALDYHADAGRGGSRLGRARKGARDRCQDRAGAGLDRGVERLLPRPRQDPGQCPARRL